MFIKQPPRACFFAPRQANGGQNYGRDHLARPGRRSSWAVPLARSCGRANAIAFYRRTWGRARRRSRGGLRPGWGIEEPVTEPDLYGRQRIPLRRGCRCSTLTCTALARRTSCSRSAGRTISNRGASALWSGASMRRSCCARRCTLQFPECRGQRTGASSPGRGRNDLRILAFESSAKAASVALLQDGQLLAEYLSELRADPQPDPDPDGPGAACDL